MLNHLASSLTTSEGEFIGCGILLSGDFNRLIKCIINLEPRSHSVTGNVRSGKVRQYTIFHWPLKKGCGNAIYAPIGLFRGSRNEGLVFSSSCAVLNKYQLCGGKFCFFRRRKSFTVKENHFKNFRRLCKWYRRKLHVPCHSIKFCVACYAVRRN